MYQALYRQWRPQTFSQLVGQDVTKKILLNQVKTGRIGHAYLFCGSRGTGKTSAAKILARAVNCENPHDGDPCGECASCRTILNDASLDIVEMDAASNSRVEEMRDLLEKVVYPPQFGRYKVYIVDEVHMLSNSAFNALLKTLEEPPEYMVFIFATTEPQKIPATILSRCQRFDFGQLTVEQIKGRLREAVDAAGADADDAALEAIAIAAEGGMRDAFSILDMCLGTGEPVTEPSVRDMLGAVDRGAVYDLGEAVLRGDSAAALRELKQALTEGRDLGVLLKDLSAYIRSLVICRLCDADTELLQVGKEWTDRLKKQAALVSTDKCMRILGDFMRAEADLRSVTSPRGTVETVILRACYDPGNTDVTALNERVAQMSVEIANTKELLRRVERLEAGVTTFAQAGAPAGTAGARAPISQSPAAPAAGPARTETAPVKETQPDAVQPGSAQDIWKKAVDTVRRTMPAAFGALSHGTFAGCKGHVYTLAFSDERENTIYYDLIRRAAYHDQVERALKEAGDPEASLDIVRSARRPNEAFAEMVERNARELIDAVGRENVIIEP